MDSATKRLLHALYANPRDLSALAEIRGHFLKQKQFSALAKVLEWWSAKAATARQAAEALFEAAELLDRGKPDPSQVITLLEKSLEYDPAYNSASIKLEALYRAQGEDDRAAQLLERRIDRISLIEALDDVFSSQEEKRVSFRSKPSDRIREASGNHRIQPTTGSSEPSSEPDNGFSQRVASDRRDRNPQIPSAPRVPDFEIRSSESRAKAFDPFDDADLEGPGFDDQPTSNRRVPTSGMSFGTEVGASFGGELEARTVAYSHSSRPPSGLVAEQIARTVDAQRLPTLDDDEEDDDDEDRFYRSYSKRAPDNGGSVARDYDFDGFGSDGARELDPRTEFYPEDNGGELRVDQQYDEEVDEEAESTYEKAETVYRVVAREPMFDPTDIDNAQPTVEVDVMWGDDAVLHVEHLSPPRAFSVGDDKTADFLIGRETLGTDRLPVLVETESGIAVVVPPGATGEVVIDDQVSTFQTLFDNGLFQPCRELTGAYQFLLPAKSTAFVGYGGFIFIVRAGVGAKCIGKEGRKRLRLAGQTWNLLAAGFVVLMLLCFAIRPPESTTLSLDAMNADARLTKYLIEPPAFEEEEIPEWLQEDEELEEGDEQEEQQEDESKPDKQAKTSVRRRQSSGPSNGRRASRLLSALASTGSSGGQSLQKVVAKLGSAGGGSPGGSFSLSNALAGLNGIGGINLGGSGTGTGIGIGSAGGEVAAKGVGTLGGRGGRGRKSVRGKVRALSLGSRVSGSLTQGQVLQVINRHMAKIQQCYERGLTRKPTLAGQVKFDWTVTDNGSVSSLRQASSTLGDTQVTSCIASAIKRMRFPKPKGGAVKITFPFIFRRAQ